MPRYMIELSHDDERLACIKALRALDRYGSHFVTHAEWGCGDGTHCGWLIAEVDNRELARMLVPPEFRQEARIVELERFTRDSIAALVAELDEAPED